MPVYAVTITHSPYKNKYKDFSYEQQMNILTEILNKFQFRDMLYTFEPTQQNYAHAHLCIGCDEEQIKDFQDKIVKEVGYSGRHNKPEHFILIEQIRTFAGYEAWIDYMYKSFQLIMPHKQAFEYTEEYADWSSKVHPIDYKDENYLECQN